MSFPTAKSQFYEQSTEEAQQEEGIINNTSSVESAGISSFLDPAIHDPTPSHNDNIEENVGPMNAAGVKAEVHNDGGGSGPDFKDQMRDAQRRDGGRSGPDFKDQMRNAQRHDDGATPQPNGRRSPPVERGEFRNDEVQLVNAALVPDEELVLEKLQKHKQRSKAMIFGLGGAVVVNVLLVAGALLAVFCLTGGKCRRNRKDGDDEMFSVTQCERARLVDLGSSKQRMSGIIDTSRQGRLCDPDIPGVWYKVTGTGEALVADTCSPLTDSDTTIAVFAGDSCGSLTCVDTNDDWTACPHGDSFSQVGWFGAADETYFVRISAFDQATLGTYSLAIRDFSDFPAAPCELDTQHECRSSDGVECTELVSPRMTACRDNPQNLQFLYVYAQCDPVVEGFVCEDYANTSMSVENVALG